MEFIKEHVDNVAIITLPGDHLDANNSKEFKTDIAALLESERYVAFDMENLRFCDSSGLGAILSCLRKLNESSGDLKLYGMSKSVRALFELVRMHRIIDILNDRDEALRAFRK
jgi:anti-sigma B factor antagonist